MMMFLTTDLWGLLPPWFPGLKETPNQIHDPLLTHHPPPRRHHRRPRDTDHNPITHPSQHHISRHLRHYHPLHPPCNHPLPPLHLMTCLLHLSALLLYDSGVVLMIRGHHWPVVSTPTIVDSPNGTISPVNEPSTTTTTSTTIPSTSILSHPCIHRVLYESPLFTHISLGLPFVTYTSILSLPHHIH